MGYEGTGRLLRSVWVTRLFTFVAIILLQVTHATASGGLFVADQTAGTIHQNSLAGDDLGVFASGLNSPSWITADGDGNIYVSQYTDNQVTKFSPSGAVLLTIPTSYTPSGVRVASDGTIYVGSYGGTQVHHYSTQGEDLDIFVEVSAGVDFITLDPSGFLYGPS